MANSRANIVESKAVEFVRCQRHVCVPEVNVADVVEESFALPFQIFDQSLTCSHVAVPQARDKTMNSRLDHSGVHHVSEPTFGAIFMKPGTINIQSAEVALSIQNIAVQKDVAPDAPGVFAPVEIAMSSTLCQQHLLNSWMAIMITEQIHPCRIRIQCNSRVEPVRCGRDCRIQIALLAPADIENVTAQNNGFRGLD